ncbi:hypothetical protein [Streptomyces aurantiacus]|uniref:hypothetical protein n=1 Tax=Streptomyces aurantiacus TaxID=47760 RepID=UPI00099E3D3D
MTGPETELLGSGPFGAEPEPELEPEPEPEADADAEPGVGADAGADTRPEYDPAAPAPLHAPRTPTGDAGVDALLDRLADADHLATDGHVEVYEDVHAGLRDTLTALDARPGPPAPPTPYNSNSNSNSNRS